MYVYTYTHTHILYAYDAEEDAIHTIIIYYYYMSTNKFSRYRARNKMCVLTES